jgi:hypothetical protein
MTNSSSAAADSTAAEQQSSSSSALWHGLGLFGESYLLFSIGTLRPLWEALYPLCFSSGSSICPHPYLTYNSLSYSVVLGVMLGMVVVGTLAGRIGRRNGSLLTASIMVGGAAALTLASLLLSGDFQNNNDDSNDDGAGRPDVLFMVMSASLFVFGVGVGGEYPLSASLASERAMTAMKERRRLEEQQEERISAEQQQAANDLMSSRLLTANNDYHSNNEANGNSNDHHHSWQTTTSANMTQIEHYNVTTQQEAQSSSCTAARKHTSSNNDNKMSSSKTLTRGREVQIVFSMQGLGIFFNSIILTFSLMLTKRKGQQQQQQQVDNDDVNQQQQQQANDDYYNNSSSYINQYHDQITLLYIWRIIYSIGLAILIYVLLSRIKHLNESEVWTQDRLRRDEEELERQQKQQCGGRLEEEGNPVGFVPPSLLPQDGKEKDENRQQQQQQQQLSETQLLFKHYGIRLFGTSITWLLWDIGE